MRTDRSINTMAALLVVAVLALLVIATAVAPGSEGAGEFVSYYDQLDANGKAIYDALDANPFTNSVSVELPIILTATSADPAEAVDFVSKNVDDTVNNALKALTINSPLAYWGWGPTSLLKPITDLTVSGNTATVTTVTLQMSLGNYPADPDLDAFQVIQKMLDDLNAAVDGFSTDAESTRDKVLAINDYITNLVTYDPNVGGAGESIYDHDAYGALVDPNHYAVCDGYSKAFLLLCEKEGIDCVVVLGTALPSLENHAWNYVKMDNGLWYAIDVTWNDGSNNAYFLKGADTFFSTHQQGTFLKAGLLSYPFKSPAISDTDYDPVSVSIYQQYAWVFAVAIVAITCAVLYRLAKGTG